MSCFSRLLGLICAVVPGLFFLACSVLFLLRWPQLGYVTGPVYALLSLITGAVCLYLGIGILFDRDRVEEETPAVASGVTPAVAASQPPVVAPPIVETQPLQAAPLPTEITEIQAAPLPTTTDEPANAEFAVEPTNADFTVEPATPPQWEMQPQPEVQPEPVSIDKPRIAAPPPTPETQIRQLASTRPHWQVTAPQLAHMANINMAVADATAREMASNGQAQVQTGPNGETIYVFNLTDSLD